MSITLRVLFFASCRDIVGEREREITIREGATVVDLVEAIGDDHPKFRTLAPSLMVSVNQDYVDRTQPLCDGDEVAFIPPVSGG